MGAALAIAAAIVAMAALAMLQTVQARSRSSTGIEARRLALLVAQSQLATAGTLVPLNSGGSSGNDLGFGWQMGIAPAGQPGLYRVTVRVGQGEKQLASLSTLRAAAP